jgi:hypothetical protein
VGVDTAAERAEALLELVATLRQADQVLAQAVDIPPDDLERIAPDLVRTWLGDALTADPVAWAEKAAVDARLAAERTEAILKQLAGRLVQAALGDGHLVPAAYPAALVAYFPAWAPNTKWYGLRHDRLSVDVRQLVRPEACPSLDGAPILVLGAKLWPSHSVEEILRLTAEARRVEDERERQVREGQERERLQREHEKRLRKQLQQMDD